MAEDNSKSFTIGSRSFLSFIALVVTFVPVMIDIEHKQNLPEYQGEGAWGLVPLFYFMLVFVWFPLAIASIAAGVAAIIKNSGRREGIIVLSAIGLFVLWRVVSS